MKIRGLLSGVCMVAALTATSFSIAQAPTFRPIRIVNPSPPGAGPDTVSRLFAERLSKAIGQPVVVDNKPGASGILAAESVAKATTDGSTLLWAYNSVISINPAVFEKLPYQPQKDFVALTKAVSGSYLLVAAPSFPANTVEELIALAKSRPAELTYGSYGSGGGVHLAAELLKSRAGINLLHVPFKTGALLDVMAGRVSVIFEPAAGAVEHVKAGKLKALGYAGGETFKPLPDVPVISKTIPNFRVDTWQGLFAPAGMTPPLAKALADESARVVGSLEFRQRVEALGLVSVSSTADEFAKHIALESAEWARLARSLNLKVD
jgi:tripartite-type tricarboxylate transporter receptor subunit TctC